MHMLHTPRSTVVGVFDNRAQAERAIGELRAAGFRDDQIGMAMRNHEATGTLAHDEGGNAGGGAVTGAVAGGVLGALAALLIPGVGPVLALGTLGGTVLAGAAAGAGLGAIAGALIGAGVPEDEATYYEGEFQQGRAIVTVQAGQRYAEAQSILRRLGAYDVETRGDTAGRPAGSFGVADRPAGRATDAAAPTGSFGRAQPAPAANTDRADSVPIHEERLVADKERVQSGEVQIRKEVHTEQRTIEVPVTREDVVIERRPVNQPTDRADLRDDQSTVRIPVYEERVEVTKQPYVVEEVNVGKRTVQENREVTDTVRREEAVVDTEGEVRDRGAEGSGRRTQIGWAEAMPRYRSHWQSHHASRGGRWEDYEPSYRYGHEMASDERYRGRSWTDVEPEFRRDWGSRYPNTPWERGGNAVREAWESVTGAHR